MTEKELWKDVPNWESDYEVSNFGCVRNKRTKKRKALDPNTNGYFRVVFYNGVKRDRVFVHRLVAKLFVACPNSLCNVVNHIDGNKQNNKASNLEWVTQSDNNKHYHQHCEQQRGGKKQPISVSFSDGTMQIYNSICDCARALKMTDKRICHILRYYNGIDPLSDKIFKRMSND